MSRLFSSKFRLMVSLICEKLGFRLSFEAEMEPSPNLDKPPATHFPASQTNWKRVDTIRDEDIDFSDIPEITPEQFAKAIARKGLKPIPKKE